MNYHYFINIYLTICFTPAMYAGRLEVEVATVTGLVVFVCDTLTIQHPPVGP